jgi:hypothetical protein
VGGATYYSGGPQSHLSLIIIKNARGWPFVKPI